MTPTTTVFSLVLAGLTSYLGFTVTEQQKTAIANNMEYFMGSLTSSNVEYFMNSLSSKLFTVKQPPAIPEPKDIGQFADDFKFAKKQDSDAIVSLKNPFLELKQKQKCVRWEDMSIETLNNIIHVFGKQNGLNSDQVEMMQLTVMAGRAIDALEVFEHGKTGVYRFIKYASARLPNGNYDFIIANYGYTWVLDVLSPEEAVKKLDFSKVIVETAQHMEGVPGDMMPEQAKDKLMEDVTSFVRINGKTSITLEEKDNQIRYFRQQSEESLSRLCPSVNFP